jgi:general secretion pathway protein I
MNASRSLGFTLLEVLLALVVFVLAFGLVLQTIGGGLRNARVAAEISQAALWAQSKLEGIGVVEKIEPRSESGRFDERFRYELRITPYQPTDSPTPTGNLTPVELYRVDLDVYWGRPGDERSERFTTLRARLREGAFF